MGWDGMGWDVRAHVCLSKSRVLCTVHMLGYSTLLYSTLLYSTRLDIKTQQTLKVICFATRKQHHHIHSMDKYVPT